jgi:HK97 family phage portal protein
MPNWFTPFRSLLERRSRHAPRMALHVTGDPVWSPRDVSAFAREGYLANPIVHRSVRMIAQAAASVPVLLYEADAEHTTHPLTDLLARPNATQTRADLLEAFYGHLMVAGNAYLEAIALDGTLRELHVLRPDRMTVVPGPDGRPAAHDYTVDGQTVRIGQEPLPGLRPVLHIGLFHPTNDHYGASPLEAAACAIDIHNAASAWNKALLDNAARPSGALVYTGGDGSLTRDQFERLKSELHDQFQGSRNAGRPLLLEGGLDWRPMALSPADMDFVASKNLAAREIALALGVPPMLLGIPGDNTYSNYQEANRTFWRQTVLPLVTRTFDAVAAWTAPVYGAGLRLAPDLDAVEALSTEREALWARVNAATFLTDAEKRAAVGYAD